MHSLSETIFQISSFHDVACDSGESRAKVEQMLTQILSTLLIIVKNPAQGDKVIGSPGYFATDSDGKVTVIML